MSTRQKVIFAILGISVFQLLKADTEFRIYCYAGGDPGGNNPLQCWSTLSFDEYTITWDNRPPKIQLLAETDNISMYCWYTFSSPELTYYVDSCIMYNQPICFCIKRQTQNGFVIWKFYSKEQSPSMCAQLIYNGKTYFPPEEDARVCESHPNTNYGNSYLWACNFASPRGQESFIQFTLPPTGIEEKLNGKANRFLKINRNPFMHFAIISYNLLSKDAGKPISLRIYNIAGELVKNLVNTTGTPGYHKVIWNVRDENGNVIPPGCYFYRLKINDKILITKKGLFVGG